MEGMRMTKGKMLLAGLSACAVALVLAIGCDKGTGPAPQKKPLELLYPTGGNSFKVDSIVTIRWRINDTISISSVVVELSIDNGKTYPPAFLISTGGSVFRPDTSISWTITSSEVSDSCIINIYKYGEGSTNDKSGRFTIHN
jgi:hypothetical protein